MLALLLVLTVVFPGVQTQPADAAAVRAAVAQLGAFDLLTRTNAGRTVHHAAIAVSAPILQETVRSGTDEYVRFRAFVMLTSIDEQRAQTVATEVLTDRNDRLRTVAYQWYEHHPSPQVLPKLLAALATEQSEFTRPALTRALAASGSDARVRAALTPLVLRGEDIYRGAVIEALGDYRGAYALTEIQSVAELEGPLQDDAVTAIGRIGNPTSRPLLVRLQEKGSSTLQPTVSSALCLLGIDCEARRAYLASTLVFASSNPGYELLLSAAVHGLAVLASTGDEKALDALVDQGVRSPDAVRDSIAIGVGLVALRRSEVMMNVLTARPDAGPAIGLLRDAFDALSEDFEEERFALDIGKLLTLPADAPRRRVAERVLTELEY